MVLGPFTVTISASPSGAKPIWPGDRGNAGGFKPHRNWLVGKGPPPGSQLRKDPGLVPGSMWRVESEVGLKWPSGLTWKPVMFGDSQQEGLIPGTPALRT